ncbi:MAG TPA: hypothetical protein DIS79_10460 [Bacteroidetes bacterium]|nr:hypothetical protein [Bacteroidota bacterium]HRK05149.1 hypothetical protein [Chlorobiota bacterium]
MHDVIRIALILLATLVASSISKADDTLKVRSIRLVDVCSQERTFVITASVGEIFSSDSLLSFDITINYDTAVLRPTTGLPSGTMAELMKYGDFSPYYNFQVPGEMRVGAFTISTPARGNRPLFALGGTFRGTCPDTGRLGVFFAPEFNPEFKKMVTVYDVNYVHTTATPTTRNNVGLTWAQRNNVISHPDTVLEHELLVHASGLIGDSLLLTLESQREDLEIDTVATQAQDGTNILNITRNETGQYTVVFTTSDSVANFTVRTRSTYRLDSTVSSVWGTLTTRNTCSCVRPGKVDTLFVTAVRTDTTTSTTDIQEGSVKLRKINEIIELQGVLGSSATIEVFGIEGNLIQRHHFTPGSNPAVSLTNFPTGMYFIVGRSGSRFDTIVTTP